MSARYCWQTAPWQDCEQQSASVLQASPSGVQTMIGSHTPLQSWEQQSPSS